MATPFIAASVARTLALMLKAICVQLFARAAAARPHHAEGTEAELFEAVNASVGSARGTWWQLRPTVPACRSHKMSFK